MTRVDDDYVKLMSEMISSGLMHFTRECISLNMIEKRTNIFLLTGKSTFTTHLYVYVELHGYVLTMSLPTSIDHSRI